MNCEDVREWIAAFTSRTIGLTERALVEAHLRQCAACRDLARPPRPPGPDAPDVSPTPAARLRLAGRDAARAGIVGIAHLGARLRARLLIPLTATARAARAGAAAARALPRATGARARALGDRLRRGSRISRSLAMRVAWLGLLAAAALYAIHHRPGHEPGKQAAPIRAAALQPPAALAGSEPPSPPALEAGTGPEPHPVAADSVIVTSAEPRVAPSAEAQVERFAMPPAVRVASVQKPEPPKPEPARTPPPAPRPEAAASPEPTPRRVPPMAHVAGRLSVKDRKVVERDLLPLLARAGGTLVGTDQDGAVLFVDAVVPQSSYEEFTRGLTRIGSWRVEAERSPLPQDVHLTIRVGG
jgi:hypothetical protein